MYIKFKNSATKYEIIQLKEQIGHELKHVFSKQKQNSDSIITYKVQHCKGKSFQRVFGKIFSQFENSYCGKYRLKQKDPTQKNMLKHYGFKSIEQLHKDFESKLNTLVKENDLASVPQLGVDKRSWKTFYDFLRLYAKDEKEAYLSSKVYRENFRDLSKPTNGEFDSLLYAEMEKFFAQKRIEANKLYI
jgi:ABC-type cobalt transport system substrate-binding protein